MTSSDCFPVRKSGGAEILKSGSAPDAAALAQINRFTRREFKTEELYTFPVALCDNEIDRDGERFTTGALETLAGLFVGKTGIFDHCAKAENQTARIYSCRVERVEGRSTSCGEPYARLVAQAYLPKTEQNAGLISELDGGIKKEVSVGCAVAKVTCSVCGADLKSDSCGHIRGERYDGVLCCAVLDEPTDAYEWSFVAVPAQREAGVLKQFQNRGADEILKTLREADGEVTISGEEKAHLLQKLTKLEEEASCGRAYRAAVREEFIRCASLARPELPADVLGRAADGMQLADLKCFAAAFRKEAQMVLPLSPQLAGTGSPESPEENKVFKI